MQCATMKSRRTLTMDWDGLREEDDDDDHFFEPSSNRASSAVPEDTVSSGSDEEDFEDSRMSFVSAASSPAFESSKPPSAMASYDMWMSEPGDIKERRRRLLHGMGLSSTKNMLRLASNKIARAVSRKDDNVPDSGSAPVAVKTESKPAPKVVKVDPVKRTDEPPSSSSPPDRQVVDWTDVHEMVTAASYTPDGQFAPCNPSEVLITSTDSRIRIYNGPHLTQKYRGFRNTSSQISASFSPDGKHVISASEDSQVYIWKVAESKNPVGAKKKNRVTVQAHEHFQCKDVTVAIPWPSSLKNEPPIVEIHSRRHSKRLTATSPRLEDNVVGSSSRRNLPPLPKKNNGLERIDSCADEDFSNSSRIDPGIGVTNSFGSSSGSLSYRDSPSMSASPSRSFSDNGGGNGGQTVQATAWGMVIVSASLDGEIRVYQNFGLPRKVANLF